MRAQLLDAALRGKWFTTIDDNDFVPVQIEAVVAYDDDNDVRFMRAHATKAGVKVFDSLTLDENDYHETREAAQAEADDLNAQNKAADAAEYRRMTTAPAVDHGGRRFALDTPSE